MIKQRGFENGVTFNEGDILKVKKGQFRGQLEYIGEFVGFRRSFFRHRPMIMLRNSDDTGLETTQMHIPCDEIIELTKYVPERRK